MPTRAAADRPPPVVRIVGPAVDEVTGLVPHAQLTAVGEADGDGARRSQTRDNHGVLF